MEGSNYEEMQDQQMQIEREAAEKKLESAKTAQSWGMTGDAILAYQEYIEMAESIAVTTRLLKDWKKVIHGCEVIADILMEQNRQDLAVPMYNKALNIYRNIANSIDEPQYEYELAEAYFKIYKITKDKNMLGNANMLFGNLAKRYDQEPKYQRMKRITDELTGGSVFDWKPDWQETRQRINGLLSRGKDEWKQNHNLPKAKECIEEYILTCESAINQKGILLSSEDIIHLASGYEILGGLLQDMKDTATAAVNYEKSAKYYTKAATNHPVREDFIHISSAYENAAEGYLSIKNFKKAAENYEYAVIAQEAIAKDSMTVDDWDTYIVLSIKAGNAWENLVNVPKAMEHFENARSKGENVVQYTEDGEVWHHYAAANYCIWLEAKDKNRLLTANKIWNDLVQKDPDNSDWRSMCESSGEELIQAAQFEQPEAKSLFSSLGDLFRR